MFARVLFPFAAAIALLSAPAAEAAPVRFDAVLSGAAEDPPNASPGTGSASVWLDTVAHTLRIQATFADLIGTTTVAHIHAPTLLPLAGNVGVAVTPGTLPGFPAGVTSGVYDITLDTSDAATFTAGFLTAFGGTTAGAETGLFAALSDRRAYFNIHTTFVPAGEIRGFFVPAAVPLPAALSLMLVGLGGLGVMRMRRV